MLFSYITSKSYTRAAFGEKLRNFFLNFQIKSYVDYTKEKVFKDATVDTSVIVIKKWKVENNSISVNKEFEMKQKRLTNIPWTFDKEEILNLRDKILSQGELIKDIEDLTINFGIKTGKNKAFMINENVKNQLIHEDIKNLDIIKPVIRGKDINKWKINYKNLYLLYIPWNFDINQYPHIKKYLNNYYDELYNRPEVKKQERYNWYCLSRYASDYYQEFEKPKLVYSEIVQKPQFAYDNNNYFPDATTFLLTSKTLNIKYILALMNSNVLFWVFRFLCTTLSEKGIRYKKKFIQELPLIIDVDAELENKICTHVDTIMEYYNNEKDMKNEIIKEENKLNDLIYGIYNISENEKKIIENDLF